MEKIGTKIMNKPVIKPEFEAVVYFNPSVWVRYNIAIKVPRISPCFQFSNNFFLLRNKASIIAAIRNL